MFTQLKDKLSNITLSANKLLLLTAIYFVALFNQPFLTRAFDRIYDLEPVDHLFAVSVPFLLLALMLIVLSLISFRYLFKPLLIIATLASSLMYFGTTTYGVVFDYSMMVNVIETDNAEAFAYLNANFVFFFLFTGILPAILIGLIKVEYRPFLREFWQRIILILSAIITILVIGYTFYSDYASFARNHRDLRKFPIPLQAIDASVKLVKEKYFTEPRVFNVLDESPQLLPRNNAETQPKKVMILVLGETARSMNFSLNGYEKPTNEFTEQLDVISFKNVTSCGTATAESVPCMFSTYKRENFDKADAVNQQNVLDIAKLAGADVLWVNNNSGCKGVCDRVETIVINKDKSHELCDGSYCFDEVLLAPMRERLANLKQDTTVIALHMVGSHGPTYYRRYPKEFAKFTPECAQSDIQNCTTESLVNTYDNTLLYTDYVLAEIIDTLQKQPDTVETSMLYISDHGESLGENGAYLHGFPYAFAPRQQIEVPMIYWSNNSAFSKQSSVQCLKEKARTGTFSHDNLFASVLGLLNVQSTTYQADDDIFSSCKQ